MPDYSITIKTEAVQFDKDLQERDARVKELEARAAALSARLSELGEAVTDGEEGTEKQAQFHAAMQEMSELHAAQSALQTEPAPGVPPGVSRPPVVPPPATLPARVQGEAGLQKPVQQAVPQEEGQLPTETSNPLMERIGSRTKEALNRQYNGLIDEDTLPQLNQEATALRKQVYTKAGTIRKAANPEQIARLEELQQIAASHNQAVALKRRVVGEAQGADFLEASGYAPGQSVRVQGPFGEEEGTISHATPDRKIGVRMGDSGTYEFMPQQVMSSAPAVPAPQPESTPELASPASTTEPQPQPEPQTAHEPWQMSREEFIDAHRDDAAQRPDQYGLTLRTPNKKLGIPEMGQQIESALSRYHQDVIVQAIAENKPVPAHVRPSWSTPLGQWLDYFEAKQRAVGNPEAGTQAMRRANLADHRDAVEMALAAGEPVPADVLAEYPQIAKKYAPASTPAAQDLQTVTSPPPAVASQQSPELALTPPTAPLETPGVSRPPVEKPLESESFQAPPPAIEPPVVTPSAEVQPESPAAAPSPKKRRRAPQVSVTNDPGSVTASIIGPAEAGEPYPSYPFVTEAAAPINAAQIAPAEPEPEPEPQPVAAPALPAPSVPAFSPQERLRQSQSLAQDFFRRPSPHTLADMVADPDEARRITPQQAQHLIEHPPTRTPAHARFFAYGLGEDLAKDIGAGRMSQAEAHQVAQQSYRNVLMRATPENVVSVGGFNEDTGRDEPSRTTSNLLSQEEWMAVVQSGITATPPPPTLPESAAHEAPTPAGLSTAPSLPAQQPGSLVADMPQRVSGTASTPAAAVENTVQVSRVAPPLREDFASEILPIGQSRMAANAQPAAAQTEAHPAQSAQQPPATQSAGTGGGTPPPSGPPPTTPPSSPSSPPPGDEDKNKKAAEQAASASTPQSTAPPVEPAPPVMPASSSIGKKDTPFDPMRLIEAAQAKGVPLQSLQSVLHLQGSNDIAGAGMLLNSLQSGHLAPEAFAELVGSGAIHARIPKEGVPADIADLIAQVSAKLPPGHDERSQASYAPQGPSVDIGEPGQRLHAHQFRQFEIEQRELARLERTSARESRRDLYSPDAYDLDEFDPVKSAIPQGPASAIGAPNQNLQRFINQEFEEKQKYPFGPQHLARGFLGITALRELVGTASGLESAYASSIMSGQQNQPQFAGLLGQGLGGIAGAGLGALAGGALGGTELGASIGAIFGGVGAIPGALLGMMLGGAVGGGAGQLAMAPAMRTLQGFQTLAPYSAAAGLPVMSGGMAGSLGKISGEINTGFHQAGGGGIGGAVEGIGRFLHLYSGMDVTSDQDVAQVIAAMGGASLASGQNLSPGALKFEARKLIEQYGQAAPDIAKTIAQAQSNINLSGGNLSDLMQKVGVAPTVTMLRNQGRGAEADNLLSSVAPFQQAQHATEGAQAVTQQAQSAYDASATTGLSTKQRTPLFAQMQAGLNKAIDAIDTQIKAALAMPGGADSNLVKQLQATRQGLVTQLLQQASERAQSLISDIQGESAVRLGTDKIALTKAQLYGGPGSFAPIGAQMSSDLGREENELRQAINDPNLPYAAKLQAKQRLREISAQRMSLPATMAGQDMRRDLLLSGTQAAIGAYEFEQASAFGSDESLIPASREGMKAQQQVAQAALRALNNPKLSVEDKAAAVQQYLQAGQAMLQMKVGAQAHVLGRIQGRAGNVETAAELTLQKASLYGDTAGINKGAQEEGQALTAEASQLNARLQSGDLTPDQAIQVQARLNALASQQLQLGPRAKETLISQMETRAQTGQAQAATQLNSAQLLGRAPQFAHAAQGLLESYSKESNQIDERLKDKDLTFEQRQGLEQRKSELGEKQTTLRVQARDEIYQKQDIEHYDLPTTHLQAARERLQYLPFMPGLTIATDIEQTKVNKAQIGALTSRMTDLRSRGELTEEQELDYTKRIEGLKTQNAKVIGELSEGFVDKLPSLSAGAPSFSGRFNSLSMAAENLAIMGSPIRNFGAVSGIQLKNQHDFLRSFGLDEADLSPRSRTAMFNNAGTDMGETNGILRQILGALTGSGGSGARGASGRASEWLSNRWAQSATNDLPFDRIQNGSN